ncbi:MAG: hypothetical protein ACRDHF_16730, partial [Tepidiformaceae bacterium]
MQVGTGSRGRLLPRALRPLVEHATGASQRSAARGRSQLIAFFSNRVGLCLLYDYRHQWEPAA